MKIKLLFLASTLAIMICVLCSCFVYIGGVCVARSSIFVDYENIVIRPSSLELSALGSSS